MGALQNAASSILLSIWAILLADACCVYFLLVGISVVQRQQFIAAVYVLNVRSRETTDFYSVRTIHKSDRLRIMWKVCNGDLQISRLHSNRISNRIESGVNIRIKSFQLQRILIFKISNYKWSKRDVWNYILLITIFKHIKVPAYDHS